MLSVAFVSFVGTVLAWIVQYKSGGILNAVFEPTTDVATGRNLYAFAFDMNRITEYMKEIILRSGNKESLEVLRSLPEELGGGESGVEKAIQNPNRENVFMVVPLVVLLILLIGVIGLLLINLCATVCNVVRCLFCCGCCCCRKGKRSDSRLDDEFSDYTGEDESDWSDEKSTDNSEDDLDALMAQRQDAIMRKIESVALRSKIVRKHQNCFCCCCHLLTTLLAVAYVIGLVVCIAFYIVMAQQLVSVIDNPADKEPLDESNIVAWLNGKNPNFNLPGTVTFILDQTVVLIEENKNQLTESLNTTLVTTTEELSPKVQEHIKKTFDRLITTNNVDKLTNDAAQLSAEFDGLSTNADTVSGQRDKVVTKIKAIQKKFSDIHSSIKTECQSSNCKITDEDMKVLIFSFDEQAVKDPQVADAIQGGAEKFGAVAENLLKLNETLVEYPENISSELMQQLNFTELVEEISNSLSEFTTKLSQEISQAKQTIPDAITRAQPFVKAIFYVPVPILILIALILALCTVFFIIEAFCKRLFSPTIKKPFDGRRKRRSHICGAIRFLVFSIVLILVLLFSVFSVVFLLLNSFLAAEVCPYISEEKGINMTDYILNSVLEDTIPEPNSSSIILLKAPKNVLNGLFVACDPKNLSSADQPRLLPNIGIDQLANFKALVERDDFKETINEIAPKAAETVSKVLPSDIIQKVEELQSFVDILGKIIQEFNAKDAVGELEKVDSLSKPELTKLQELVKKELNNSPISEELKSAISDLENVNNSIVTLREAYAEISTKESIPGGLKAYLEVARNTIKTISNNTEIEDQFNRIITPSINGLLNNALAAYSNAVDKMIRVILPCGGLHYVVKATVYTGCSETGLIPRFFGWALSLALVTLFSFLSYVGVYNLWCVQSRQIKRRYG